MIRRLGGFRHVATWRGAVSRLLGLIIFCILVLYYVPTRPQSFVVSATTEILQVETLGDGSTEWDLPLVEACLRADTPVKRQSDPDWCGSSLYSYERLEDATLRWEAGYTLTFRAYDPDYLEIYVEHIEGADPVMVSPSSRVAQGSVLRIPYLFEEQRSRIPVRGYATIGEVPNASDALVLSQGQYEVRQTLGVFHSQSHVVMAGSFFPGDRVSFARTDSPFWQFWAKSNADQSPWATAHLFIEQSSPETRAFNVVATTEPTFSALQLTRIGGQPTDIAVPWTQRLIADALPVAIATLLGLVGSIVALANAYIATPPRPKD